MAIHPELTFENIQTYLPYSSFAKTAETLDQGRLPIQIYIVHQLLRTLCGESRALEAEEEPKN